MGGLGVDGAVGALGQRGTGGPGRGDGESEQLVSRKGVGQGMIRLVEVLFTRKPVRRHR